MADYRAVFFVNNIYFYIFTVIIRTITIMESQTIETRLLITDLEQFRQAIDTAEMSALVHENPNPNQMADTIDVTATGHDLFFLGMQYQLNVSREQTRKREESRDVDLELELRMGQFLNSIDRKGCVIACDDMRLYISIEANLTSAKDFQMFLDDLSGVYPEYALKSCSVVYLDAIKRTSITLQLIPTKT